MGRGRQQLVTDQRVVLPAFAQACEPPPGPFDIDVELPLERGTCGDAFGRGVVEAEARRQQETVALERVGVLPEHGLKVGRAGLGCSYVEEDSLGHLSVVLSGVLSGLL